MQSPEMTDATTAGSSPSITPASTPATSEGQNEYNNTPERWPAKQSSLTQDFHLDTPFNPVWTSGPHVSSFSPNGTAVRPETYVTEPYPGYHADRALYADSARASHFHGFGSKPWKNVAITEQDDAEWEEMRERARIGAVGKWRPYSLYYRSWAAGAARFLAPEQPEFMYTWPPKPHGQ